LTTWVTASWSHFANLNLIFHTALSSIFVCNSTRSATPKSGASVVVSRVIILDSCWISSIFFSLLYSWGF
jgi:hypothetical protein